MPYQHRRSDLSDPDTRDWIEHVHLSDADTAGTDEKPSPRCVCQHPPGLHENGVGPCHGQLCWCSKLRIQGTGFTDSVSLEWIPYQGAET